MGLFDKICKYVSDLTTINQSYIALALATSIVILLFSFFKKIGKRTIRKKIEGRKEYIINQAVQNNIKYFRSCILISNME